jgi:hypothetical protein
MPSKSELQQLTAVRQTTVAVFQLAKTNQLDHFVLDLQHLPEVIEFVVQLIRRDCMTFTENNIQCLSDCVCR